MPAGGAHVLIVVDTGHDRATAAADWAVLGSVHVSRERLRLFRHVSVTSVYFLPYFRIKSILIF